MTRRWQEIINMLLAAWLFVSPWALGYVHETAARNAWTFGAVLFALAAFAASEPRYWKEVLEILLGTWLIVSPWALQFASRFLIARNTATVGALFVVFAAWALYRGAHSAERLLGQH